jgi:hypothetical protein
VHGKTGGFLAPVSKPRRYSIHCKSWIMIIFLLGPVQGYILGVTDLGIGGRRPNRPEMASTCRFNPVFPVKRWRG